MWRPKGWTGASFESHAEGGSGSRGRAEELIRDRGALNFSPTNKWPKSRFIEWKNEICFWASLFHGESNNPPGEGRRLVFLSTKNRGDKKKDTCSEGEFTRESTGGPNSSCGERK